MPVLITPGAFTQASSFADWAHRLRGEVVVRPQRPFPQLQRGGLNTVAGALDEAIEAAPDDGSPLVLIGHSMGGLLTLRAGLVHEIDAQVLLMPALPGGLAGHLLRFGRQDPVSAAKFIAIAVSSRAAGFASMAPPRGLYTADADLAVVAEAQRHRADESWSALLQMIVGSRTPVQPVRVPTLVVGGKQDGLVPPHRVRELAAALHADHLEFDVAHNFSEEPAGRVVEDGVQAWLRDRSLIA
jgi:pimeloyl-ACP methyl ester carboxylesterase